MTPSRTSEQFSPSCQISGPQFSPITPTSEAELRHQDDSEPHPPQSTISPPKQLFGFKLCGDNVDWRIVPSSIRCDKQAQSVHCFHSYGAKDRTDLSGLSDIQPTCKPSMSEVVSKLLPSSHEESLLHDEFAILLARMLCSSMEYFRWTFAGCIDWHIQHRYTAEMSTKSEVVSEWRNQT